MMSRMVARGLVQKGYGITMAADMGMINKDDDTEHLPYASALGLVLVTFDHAFAGRTLARTDHSGLVCWTGKQNDFGMQIETLAEFASAYTYGRSHRAGVLAEITPIPR